LWTDYGIISAKRSDKFVKTKADLVRRLKRKK
jgi:hypothetical protein